MTKHSTTSQGHCCREGCTRVPKTTFRFHDPLERLKAQKLQFIIPWAVAGLDPLSVEFSGQEYWSGFSSVAQSCLTLCDPMDLSSPGLPVHHQLLQFTQTHVHQVGDATQPSHPLQSPSPPLAFLNSFLVFLTETDCFLILIALNLLVPI